MRIGGILLGMALFCFTGASQAEIVAKSCTGCTDLQFETQARGLGPGKHYLYDFYGDDLRRYDVVAPLKFKGEHGSPLQLAPDSGLLVTRMSIPSPVQDTFDATRLLWLLNGSRLGYSTVPVTLDPDDPLLPASLRVSSAWDLVVIEARQHALIEYMTHDYYWVDRQVPSGWTDNMKMVSDLIHNLLSGDFAKIAFGSDPFGVTYVVTMPGGGKVRITYDNTHDYELWYRTGQSRDASGNLIPERPADMAGNGYEFDDRRVFDRYRTNYWGIPWPSNFCTIVACVAIPPGSTAQGIPQAGDASDSVSPLQVIDISCECAL